MESELESPSLSRTDIARMSADVVSAYLANNAVPTTAVPDLIRTVHEALSALEHAQGATAPAPTERQRPAVPVSKSIQDDYIVCLEDGARLKMLKRYLRSRYNMSPEEYRRKWGLPPDYPMVAPAYAQRRSDFARQIGLGKGVRRKRAAK
jgi:predicted transcriptional regulator